jgi:membrane-associated phospholipid phosphatase
MLQRLLRTVILFFVLLTAPCAWADERPSAVRWRDEWPRFRAWEYVATAGALGGAFVLRFAGPAPPDNWQGGVLFDDAVMDRIALEGPDNHVLAGDIGDAMFYGSMAYRLVDSIVVPLAGYGDGDLALQMAMIDLEAFGTVAIVLWGSQIFIGRQRPFGVRHCDDPEFVEVTAPCDPGDDQHNRSFIAGHAAVVTAAAGVTCLHHGHIPLYGGDGDEIACGTMVGAAAMTGVVRMMTEDHYPTDTLLGWGLGAFAGWFVPAALHYGFGGRRGRAQAEVGRVARTSYAPRALVLPWASDAGAGAAFVGIL